VRLLYYLPFRDKKLSFFIGRGQILYVELVLCRLELREGGCEIQEVPGTGEEGVGRQAIGGGFHVFYELFPFDVEADLHFLFVLLAEYFVDYAPPPDIEGVAEINKQTHS
jgi:hypothetical protein